MRVTTYVGDEHLVQLHAADDEPIYSVRWYQRGLDNQWVKKGEEAKVKGTLPHALRRHAEIVQRLARC